MSDVTATLRPLAAEDADHFKWTRSPPVRKVAAALDAARQGSARFVGGCVRDSLLGAAPTDVDIATQLIPEDVIRALHEAGLRAAPTGIEHGTVTGVADGVGVEITTLRADVSTDGRRATVAFTDDWAVDARRRDFTLNAIYLTTDGRLFDPVGGVADLKAGKVAFIGAPDDRICEDFLRILRFFRFTARFARDFDAAGLGACAAGRAGLKRLSAERVGDEMSKILTLPRAPIAIAAMAKAEILAEVWPASASLDTLENLKALSPEAPPPLGLAALWGERGEGIDAALRLSNAASARRRQAVGAAALLRPDLPPREARAVLYRFGEEAYRDGALLAAARQGRKLPIQLFDVADNAAPPRFPFTGKDVIALGVPAGPKVAEILAAAEAAWIDEDFPGIERAREILLKARATS